MEELENNTHESYIQKDVFNRYVIEGDDVQNFSSPDGYDQGSRKVLEGVEVIEDALDSHEWTRVGDGHYVYDHQLAEGDRHHIRINYDTQDVTFYSEFEDDTQQGELSEEAMREIEARLRGHVDPETGVKKSRPIFKVMEEERGELRNNHVPSGPAV